MMSLILLSYSDLFWKLTGSDAQNYIFSSQKGIHEVKVVGLEPSCGWLLDAPVFPCVSV